MEKNKTEIIAQITALLSQLVENEDNKQNESAAVSAKAPFEMLTIKKMRPKPHLKSAIADIAASVPSPISVTAATAPMAL